MVLHSRSYSRFVFPTVTLIGSLFFANSIFTIPLDSSSIKLTPFPQTKIDEATLRFFYPQILAELDGNFLHQNDERTHRDTIQYGYSFVKLEKGDFNFTPIPEFLRELGKAICDALGEPQIDFNNVILSLYEENFHLEPHIDTSPTEHPHKPYYFTEKIYGIIIEADSTGHLYFVKYEEDALPPLDLEPIYEVEEEPGTIFCLEGAYRNAPYFHAVSSVSNRRLSITFRTVITKNPAPICSNSPPLF